MNSKTPGILLSLSFVISMLIVTAGLVGIYSPGLYAKETQNWQLQTLGQDMINVFLVAPLLLISGIMVFIKIKRGLLLWTGSLLYITYTYIIYCFDIHFNGFFIEYCIILGLSFYLCIYSFYFQGNNPGISVTKPGLNRLTGIYFLLIALLFGFLWLSEIIPAITGNTVPPTLQEAGLPTNPVEVIDLSIFLPGIFIVGILLLRGNKPAAAFLAPVLLTFFILMDLTIAFLNFLMISNSIDTGISVVVIMMLLALFSLILLILYLKTGK